MFIITAVYSALAFFNLGDTTAPETLWTGSRQDFIIIEFDEVKQISRMQFFLGAAEERKVNISFSDDSVVWTDTLQTTLNSVFAWGEAPLYVNARYIRITSLNDVLYLHELAFRDMQDELLQPVAANASELFDEQQLVPIKSTNLNSTYFDEIYHARTAYEFLNRLSVYEWTHPPLGKVLIAFGIKIFGMNPFGWRFAGVTAGILMIPLIYIFAKKMFRETFWATFATILFTFDFMHLAQTRLATIDSFVTLFIIGMYYFMYRYFEDEDSSFSVTSGQTVNLFLSGLFMSLAIASKWQGLYSAVGLAILFFIAFIKKRMTIKDNIKTILCCVVFFVAIPVLIYYLSYWWFLQSPYKNGISSIIENNIHMFNYHSRDVLSSEHPFSSKWWTWPLDIRPIFYYIDVEGSKAASISSFGNPLVWWCGVFATIYAVFALVKRRDKNILFLLIGYASQILPWVFVERTTYIYHYFPSVMFIVMLIAYTFKTAIPRKGIHCAYLAAVVLVFAMFYPVISGLYVNTAYINFLRWLPSWQLM